MCTLLHLTCGMRDAAGAAASPESQPAKPVFVPTNYHGWPHSMVGRNGLVEVIVVPAIGRVMQFRFVGESEEPFWENRALIGQPPNPKSREWGNFGGDKTWPAPQADWPKVSDRAWPPPPAFDSLPVKAFIEGDNLMLTSPVDPFYGIITVRRIRLSVHRAVMTIETTYQKVEGQPKRVGIWIITQLTDPVGVYLPVAAGSRFQQGYHKQSADVPPSLKVEDNWISLRRDPVGNYKIGSDAETLIWVGKDVIVRIDSPRVSGLEYPDRGSSSEVYTNGDPLPYVELEMLGPLHDLRIGDSIAQTNTYTLLRRTGSDIKSDVLSAFGSR
jgi:hypothetical protein